MMKKALLAVGSVLVFLSLLPSVQAQEKSAPSYEMTTYYVGFLFRGPKWSPAVTPESERGWRRHRALCDVCDDGVFYFSLSSALAKSSEAELMQ